MKTMIRLFKSEEGATAIEYGLIAALISVAAILAMRALGSSLTGLFTSVSEDLNDAVTGGR